MITQCLCTPSQSADALKRKFPISADYHESTAVVRNHQMSTNIVTINGGLWKRRRWPIMWDCPTSGCWEYEKWKSSAGIADIADKIRITYILKEVRTVIPKSYWSITQNIYTDLVFDYLKIRMHERTRWDVIKMDVSELPNFMASVFRGAKILQCLAMFEFPR